jgi:hypothetical protein
MIEVERDALVLEIRAVYARAMRQIMHLFDKPPSSFEEQEDRRHMAATIRQAADLDIAPLFCRLCESLAAETHGDIRILSPLRDEHIERARQLIAGR